MSNRLLEVPNITPTKLFWKKWIPKLGLLFGGYLLIFVVVALLGQGRASAGTLGAPAFCGDAGPSDAYAGLVLNLQWWDWRGGLHEADGVNARVVTWGGTWSPPGNVLRLNGDTSEAKATRYAEVTFGQSYRPDCDYFGAGSWGVILDYGSGWVLDCDTSKHPWAQEFYVVGSGTPWGARAGGWWDQTWIAPPNGDRTFITLRYHEPPPPDTQASGALESASCTTLTGWARDPDAGGGVIRVHVYVDGPPGVGRWGGEYWANQAGNRFSIDVSQFRDLRAHSFYVYAIGTAPGGGDSGANPLLSGSPKSAGPCVTPTCGNLSSSPSNPQPGEEFTVTVTANYSLGARGQPPNSSSQQMTVNITGLYSNGNAAYSATTTSASFTTPSLTAPNNMYATTWSFSGSGVSTGTCDSSVNVGNKPYLRVYGGDVLAGSGFGASNCTQDAAAKILTYNTGSPNYGGGGTQYTAQAPSAITEFTSASMRDAASNGPPKGLTFANTTASVFGGEFGTGICFKDYFNEATATADPGSTIAGDNVSSSNGGGTTERKVLKRNGNVTITGNIEYEASGSWTDLRQIPSYYLIVQGNIYIDKDVTRLDGVYIAQPTDPNNPTDGKIYTCATNGAPTPGNALYDNCNTSLTINGSLVADHIIFGRTYGTLRSSSAKEPSSSSNLAEIFNYSPELYLVNPNLSNSTSGGYDSITSLPPIL